MKKFTISNAQLMRFTNQHSPLQFIKLKVCFFLCLSITAIHCFCQINNENQTANSPASFITASHETLVKFNRKTSRNGLSQSFVRSITSDRKGFIWIGTTNGLNRYDGYTFKIYQSNPKDKAALSTNNIYTTYTDKQGVLYVASENGGLNVYNPSTDNFTVYKNNPNDPTSIGSNRVTVIFEDSNGILWIGSDSNGLEIFDRKTHKFKKVFSFSPNKNSLVSNVVRCITEDKEGNLWVGTEEGISVISRDRKEIKNYLHTTDKKSLSTNPIRSIFTDTQGEVWIGTAFGGLNLYDKKDDSFTKFRQSKKPHSLLGDYVPGICEATDGKIWVATNWGMSVFNKYTQSFTNYVNDAFDNNSLVDNGLNTVYADRQGNIWVGSIAGVSIYEVTGSKFPNYANNPGNVNSLGSKEAFCFYEDMQQRLWIGLREGFDMFDRQTQTFIHHRTKTDGKRIGTVMSFFEDQKKNLWIGTFDEGVYRYNQKNNRYQTVNAEDPVTKAVIPLKDIWFIKQDQQGELYLASYSTGIYKFDEKRNKFYKFRWEGKDLPTGGVTCFFIDHQSNMWIAESLHGLLKINKEKGIYQAYKNFSDNNKTIVSNDITTIHEDTKGNLWIGTKNGLSYLNTSNNTISNYTVADGLNSNQVNAVLEDSSGDMWLSTNKGISCFNSSTKTFKNFSVNNSFDYNEFVERCALKLQSGEMVFGGLNGFNLFSPHNLVMDKKVPDVFITDFQLFNKSVSVGDHDSILKKVINETDKIHLSYKQNIFSFEYIALNLLRTKENQYAYKLEGFDKDWISAGTSKKASYTNIPPGKYIFRVKASNNDGVWNEKGTSIKIIITPPFWMTWWFKTLAVTVIVGGAAGFYISRINQIKKQKEKLEIEVQQRTAEVVKQAAKLKKQSENLQEMNEELQAQSEELQEQTHHLHITNRQLEKERKKAEKANQAKSVFLATMSHEIRTPMNGVIGMASLLAETRLDNEQGDYVNVIRTSGEALLTVINDILDFSKIESGNLELEYVEFDLRQCIEQVMDVFAGKAATQGLDLVYNIDTRIPVQIIGDSCRLRQILLNLVSNAMKFTHKGEVFLNVYLCKTEQDNIEIKFDVRDSGIGIAKDKLSRLFKAFSQVDSSTTRKYGGTGLGLVISERLIKLMGGEIGVESEEGKGTTFSFNIQSKIGQSPQRQNVIFNAAENEGKKVLIIDDNPTNLTILKAQMEMCKLVAMPASSGKQAIEIVSAGEQFQLVISDMQMPEMDGIELAGALKKCLPHVPIILLSSIGDESRSKYPHLFNSVLTKPVKQAQLFNLVHAALNAQKQPVQEVKNNKSKFSAEFAQQFPLEILLAEDDLINQKLALIVLNKLGYKPEVANNGKQAIEMALQKPYDVIFMDMLMPEVDGIEATKTIRKISAHQPAIIAMTANAMAEDREACFKAGMNNYITKPFSHETLLQALQKVANKSLELA